MIQDSSLMHKLSILRITFGSWKKRQTRSVSCLSPCSFGGRAEGCPEWNWTPLASDWPHRVSNQNWIRYRLLTVWCWVKFHPTSCWKK